MTTATLPASASAAGQAPPLPTGQKIARIGLYLAGAIALLGGTLQMVLGQPDTTPRLDNVHRFLAGIYFSTGLIMVYTARSIRQQGPLVYLIAFGIGMAALGRLVSISIVGLPQPAALWLGYLVPEMVLPVLIAGGQYLGTRR